MIAVPCKFGCDSPAQSVRGIFFDGLQKFKEYSRLCLGKWASPAYDTVHPRNARHMAKTQSSHAHTRGLSHAVRKIATPHGKPIMHKI